MKKMAMILAGNTLYAAAVAFFILPLGLITGGSTGMALVANRLAGIPVAAFVGAFNVLMFVIGLWALGKEFALKTLVSTFYYPIALGWMQKAWGGSLLTGDRMLGTVCAGLLVGAAIGIVLRAGASTGGMDIPPLILHRRFGIPVSVLMYGFDILILAAQMAIADSEQILYGMILVLIYTIVLEKVMVIGSNRVKVEIISSRYEEINSMIQAKLDRGTTLFEIEGGYLREDCYAIVTVVSGRELPRLNDMVKEVDEHAFLVISRVSEVRGRGFTLDKQYFER